MRGCPGALGVLLLPSPTAMRDIALGTMGGWVRIRRRRGCCSVQARQPERVPTDGGIPRATTDSRA